MKRRLIELVILLILPAALAFGQHENCSKAKSRQGDLFVDCNRDGLPDILVVKAFGITEEVRIAAMPDRIQKLVLNQSRKAGFKIRKIRQ